MTWSPRGVRGGEPPLEPSPDEARRELRRELLNPDYHERDVLERVLTWAGRGVDRALGAASGTPTLTAASAIAVGLVLLAALLWLLSRARFSPRAAPDSGPVLGAGRATAAELRARAEAALATGDHENAVVDGYRALAVRQVERGLLEDRPGTTAHEVARTLAADHPRLAPDLTACAALFDRVHYGHRSASRADVTAVLALDDVLAGVR